MISRVVASILSGILLSLSFPKADISILAWIALLPLFFVIIKSEPLHAFWYGFIFGATFFTSLLYWILNLLRTQTDMSFIISLLVFSLFMIILSLFPSFFSYLTSVSAKGFGHRAIFIVPMIWVSLELLRNYIFGGFPWGFIGYTQSSFLSLIQMASISGVYGVSFIIVLCNASLAFLFLEKRKVVSWIPLLLSLIAIATISGWGHYSLSYGYQSRGKEIPVACIQGNYGAQTSEDVTQIAILSDYINMTIEAAKMNSRLIVWPESTAHLEICCTEGYADLLSQLCHEHEIDMVLGSIHQSDDSEDRMFNSAFHIDSSGKVAGRYDKIHLVPYGEYVPIPRVLFFVRKFVEAAGDFSKGEEYAVMDYNGNNFSILICYEVIFPDAVRAFVRKGATFFINITNDSWFGKSAAPYQHFQFLILRAIESGRYFIRCASTGISGIISPKGEVLTKTEIFTKKIIKADISPIEKKTFYSHMGDWLAIACVIITLGLIVSLCFKKIISKKSQKGVINIEI